MMKYRKKYGSREQFDAYRSLCERVRKVSEEAADYLESDDVISDCHAMYHFEYDSSLLRVMHWRSTRQGSDYWVDIHNKLVEAKLC